ncbi:MAG: hypothetical protein EU539_00130 [Promethearchaeota archaeon]|nr:MAG: hypothetical protein EU539_00130 [Candidatus Lokiarchaeota archaeon]
MVLTKTKKYLVLIAIDLLVSAYIWYVNGVIFNNRFEVCLILSTTTFLIIYVPFEIYWSFRDIWVDRWTTLYSKDLDIIRKDIKLKDGVISADLIMSKNEGLIQSKNTIIIVCQGFSDTKKSLQYFYYPLAYQGHVILTYDARGIGESKSIGHRADFLARIEDFKSIVNWVMHDNKELGHLQIYAAGISIGALTALCGGFTKKEISKILAISSIANYRKSVSRANLVVKFSYLMKGVDLYPEEELNKKISPYFIFKEAKKNTTPEEWKELRERIFLIHAKNDKIVKFFNFEDNLSMLELPKSNYLVLNKGGHMLKKNEMSLVGTALRFFNS